MIVAQNQEVSPEEFVGAWVTSKSVVGAVRRLTILSGRSFPKSEVLAWVKFYRLQGVELKALSGEAMAEQEEELSEERVESLNRLVEKIRAGNSEEAA